MEFKCEKCNKNEADEKYSSDDSNYYCENCAEYLDAMANQRE